MNWQLTIDACQLTLGPFSAFPHTPLKSPRQRAEYIRNTRGPRAQVKSNNWVNPQALQQSRTSRWWFAAFAAVTLAATGLATHYWLNARAQPPVLNALQNLNRKKAPEPMRELALLIFKSEKKAELWGLQGAAWRQLREYPINASTGSAGPKLREGDRQIPEGSYRIARLDTKMPRGPLLLLDYPNAFDLAKARADGRTKLGKDIAIQSTGSSAGGVTLGAAALEDLCAVIEQVGLPHTAVILAPNDLRQHIPVRNPWLKLTWLDELYARLTKDLAPFK